MADFSVKVQQSGNVALGFHKLSGLGPQDFRTSFGRIGRAWLLEIDDGFSRETDPFGNPWEELSPRTIRYKQKKGSANPEAILQDLGLMRNSFNLVVSREGFAIGNDRVFPDGTTAEIHQFGGRHPVSNAPIPSRPMMPLDRLPAEWERIAEGYLGVDMERILNAFF